MLSYGDWSGWICHGASPWDSTATFLDRQKSPGSEDLFQGFQHLSGRYRSSCTRLHHEFNARASCELLRVVERQRAGLTALKIKVAHKVLRNNRSHSVAQWRPHQSAKKCVPQHGAPMPKRSWMALCWAGKQSPCNPWGGVLHFGMHSGAHGAFLGFRNFLFVPRLQILIRAPMKSISTCLSLQLHILAHPR
jgi:hypothetical protein